MWSLFAFCPRVGGGEYGAQAGQLGSLGVPAPHVWVLFPFPPSHRCL